MNIDVNVFEKVAAGYDCIMGMPLLCHLTQNKQAEICSLTPVGMRDELFVGSELAPLPAVALRLGPEKRKTLQDGNLF